MKTYNQKAFLLPDCIRSMAAYHGKVKQDGVAVFRIHDCETGIRLWNDLTDPEEVPEFIAKLRTLAAGANEFADFIEKNYTHGA